jgi:hypothetical protein
MPNAREIMVAPTTAEAAQARPTSQILVTSGT